MTDGVPHTKGAGEKPSGPTLAEGQMITVFRSRRRPGTDSEYGDVAAAMLAAARRAPGFVDFKSFTADDGEHVSVITFASPEDLAAWRDDVDHRRAQERGRSTLYSEYAIQTGSCTHARQWRRGDD
jgi:heme-degrading monooxygenase HmoA